MFRQGVYMLPLVLFALVHLSHAHLFIVGGDEITEKDPDSRTTVALLSQTAMGTGICTGTIFTDTLIMTAAHCVTDEFGDELRPQQIKVIFENNLLDGINSADVRESSGVVAHSLWRGQYSLGKDQNDIAILKFKGGLPLGYHKAKILMNQSALKNGQVTTLAGYGVTTMNNGGLGSGVLRKVNTQIYKSNFSKTEVLLDQRAGKGACHGDSGGPAIVQIGANRVVWGVTNRGYPENAPDDCKQFSVYTKIAAHKKFITQAVKDLSTF